MSVGFSHCYVNQWKSLLWINNIYSQFTEMVSSDDNQETWDMTPAPALMCLWQKQAVYWVTQSYWVVIMLQVTRMAVISPHHTLRLRLRCPVTTWSECHWSPLPVPTLYSTTPYQHNITLSCVKIKIHPLINCFPAAVKTFLQCFISLRVTFKTKLFSSTFELWKTFYVYWKRRKLLPSIKVGLNLILMV